LNIFLKKLYISFSTNIGRGGILVRPEGFIKENYNNDVERAILNDLYIMRNCDPFSVSEITQRLLNRYICKDCLCLFKSLLKTELSCPGCHSKNTLLLLAPKSDVAERTMRNHLKRLNDKGDLEKTSKTPTGERGRAPDVYSLSESFKTRLEDYLNRKEMKLGLLMNATIRCNDPMQCSDPTCKICANAGIKTRWDQKMGRSLPLVD
jgi:hypothetical protein